MSDSGRSVPGFPHERSLLVWDGVAESLYKRRSGGYGHVFPGFPCERSLLAWDGSVAGDADAEDRAFVDSIWNHRDSIWNRDRSKSPGLCAMPFGITNALCMTLGGMECQ